VWARLGEKKRCAALGFQFSQSSSLSKGTPEHTWTRDVRDRFGIAKKGNVLTKCRLWLTTRMSQV